MKQAFRTAGRGIALGVAAIGLVVGVAAAPAAASAQQIQETTSDSSDVWLDRSIQTDVWLDV